MRRRKSSPASRGKECKSECEICPWELVLFSNLRSSCHLKSTHSHILIPLFTGILTICERKAARHRLGNILKIFIWNLCHFSWAGFSMLHSWIKKLNNDQCITFFLSSDKQAFVCTGTNASESITPWHTEWQEKMNRGFLFSYLLPCCPSLLFSLASLL